MDPSIQPTFVIDCHNMVRIRKEQWPPCIGLSQLTDYLLNTIYKFWIW